MTFDTLGLPELPENYRWRIAQYRYAGPESQYFTLCLDARTVSVHFPKQTFMDMIMRRPEKPAVNQEHWQRVMVRDIYVTGTEPVEDTILRKARKMYADLQERQKVLDIMKAVNRDSK
ncbi:MAG: hypothetical protein ACRC5T_03260 [Cetobacterium sp.]